jgi:exodeoxyribonuclease VII small subunit
MKDEKNFETLLKELEEITNSLKREDLPLEEAITLYKQGIALSKVLTEKLNQAKEIVLKEINE